MFRKTNVTELYPYEEFIQERVEAWLCEHGWRVITSVVSLSEHGPDIVAGNYGKTQSARLWTIEVKGGSRGKAEYQKAETISVFHSGIAQILTRMGRNTQTASKGGDKYSIALPDYFRKHVIKTTSCRPKLPWNVCKILNLTIFFVDEHGAVEYVDWKTIKKLNMENNYGID
ncbi:MAG: hypothetical protein ACM3MA_02400 [Acidobacteriota bacterium]